MDSQQAGPVSDALQRYRDVTIGHVHIRVGGQRGHITSPSVLIWKCSSFANPFLANLGRA
jgi:hypothetical protein